MLQENIVETEGRKFRYLQRKGDGPTLLFLHGLSDSADQFSPIAAHLPEEWHLLAFDQRGHGGSWKPEKGYSPLDYSQDIKNFIDAVGINSLHIFGHSMGGRNALLFSTKFPRQIQCLILGDIGPDKNLGDIKATIDFFNSLPTSFNTEEEARSHLQKRKPGYSDTNIEILMKNLEKQDNGTLVWRYSKDACIQSVTESRSREWWEYLPEVKCPVLLLHVKDSSELSTDVAKRMIEEIPDIQYQPISNSGHNFQLEQPENAAREIQRFIETP